MLKYREQACTAIAVMLESGVDYVLGMVGDMGFDYETIVATLRHFHFDGEKSVEWLLDNGVWASRTSSAHRFARFSLCFARFNYSSVTVQRERETGHRAVIPRIPRAAVATIQAIIAITSRERILYPFASGEAPKAPAAAKGAVKLQYMEPTAARSTVAPAAPQPQTGNILRIAIGSHCLSRTIVH
jgi:hypothetical protein